MEDTEKRICIITTKSQFFPSKEENDILFIGSLKEAGKFIEKIRSIWKCSLIPLNYREYSEFMDYKQKIIDRKERFYNKRIIIYSFPLNQNILNLEKQSENKFPDYNEFIIDQFYLSIKGDDKRLGILEF